MSTFQPITPNWLAGAWDQFVRDDPELELAYDYEDYPSDMTGEGNWIDLFLTVTDEFPVGRLWLNFETENIGLEQLQDSNINHATKVALTLRELHHHDVNAIRAYEFIRNEYFAGQELTGELSDAVVALKT